MANLVMEKVGKKKSKASKTPAKGAAAAAAASGKAEAASSKKRKAPEAKGALSKKGRKELNKAVEEGKKVNASIAERHAEDLNEALKHVNEEQVRKAVHALVNHVKKHREAVAAKKAKMDLFEGEDEEAKGANASSKDFVLVSLALIRPPVDLKKTFKARTVPVRHPMRRYDGNLDICLLVKDSKEAKEFLETHPVQGVKKVLSLVDLRKGYHSHKSRRELSAMYDVFLADQRIVPMLPKALGRVFYSTDKMPLPVTMTSKNSGKPCEQLESRVQRAIETASFQLKGSCSTMRAARVTWEDEQHIVDNVLDCIAGAVPVCPQGWSNIQAIHIKTGNSAALPVFVQAPTETPMEVDEDEPKEEDEPKDKKTKKTKTPKKTPKKAAKGEAAEKKAAKGEAAEKKAAKGEAAEKKAAKGEAAEKKAAKGEAAEKKPASAAKSSKKAAKKATPGKQKQAKSAKRSA